MKVTIIPVLALLVVAACPPPPPPPPPPKDACTSISIPSINGPGSGTNTLCTLPSECREDTMTTLLDTSFCNDKSGGSCPAAGNSACSNQCVGVVNSSGLVVTPNSCTWDRNSECKTASGAAGSNCTCKWTIPAGSALSCGCGCK